MVAKPHPTITTVPWCVWCYCSWYRMHILLFIPKKLSPKKFILWAPSSRGELGGRKSVSWCNNNLTFLWLVLLNIYTIPSHHILHCCPPWKLLGHGPLNLRSLLPFSISISLRSSNSSSLPSMKTSWQSLNFIDNYIILIDIYFCLLVICIFFLTLIFFIHKKCYNFKLQIKKKNSMVRVIKTFPPLPDRKIATALCELLKHLRLWLVANRSRYNGVYAKMRNSRFTQKRVVRR